MVHELSSELWESTTVWLMFSKEVTKFDCLVQHLQSDDLEI